MRTTKAGVLCIAIALGCGSLASAASGWQDITAAGPAARADDKGGGPGRGPDKGDKGNKGDKGREPAGDKGKK